MRNRNVLNMRKALPCMSWSPKNLYNLWKRTAGPQASELTFKHTTQATLFQQRWKSKAAVRAYHGDYIPEKSFKRWYLPDNIPDVRPKRRVLNDDKLDLEEFAKRKVKERIREEKLEEEIEEKGMAPVGSLMFSEVERRIDTVVFRACFTHSIYEARRLVIHGYVKLNGKKHMNANTRLAPGDMVSVDPRAIRFLRERAPPPPPPPPPAKEGEENENSEASESVKAEETNEVIKPTKPSSKNALTPCHIPDYASPWLFVPAYLEVSYATCSAVYVRHPTARPGYSEIPTPYDADGALIRYAWEWYVQRRPRARSQSKINKAPEDRVLSLLKDVHPDKRMKFLGPELRLLEPPVVNLESASQAS
ncbi:hypothetical protein CVT24_000960 [Panaeolus cyanescens]|uniref:RNA-binding S4 domain-containing protein n=1 Tax=Panaeolus cyanescens TaxID=181874 RepID=A0A409YCE2_9AGAR|nr:hypothetical protein CVT24_000960 [Panaeolus cyanescens]